MPRMEIYQGKQDEQWHVRAVSDSGNVMHEHPETRENKQEAFELAQQVIDGHPAGAPIFSVVLGAEEVQSANERMFRIMDSMRGFIEYAIESGGLTEKAVERGQKILRVYNTEKGA